MYTSQSAAGTCQGMGPAVQSWPLGQTILPSPMALPCLPAWLSSHLLLRESGTTPHWQREPGEVLVLVVVVVVGVVVVVVVAVVVVVVGSYLVIVLVVVVVVVGVVMMVLQVVMVLLVVEDYRTFYEH